MHRTFSLQGGVLGGNVSGVAGGNKVPNRIVKSIRGGGAKNQRSMMMGGGGFSSIRNEVIQEEDGKE